jgi:flagellar basal-body rod protein FlgF
MDSITYLAANMEISSMRRIANIANNIAGSATAGFAEDQVVFSSYMLDDKHGKTYYAKDHATISSMQEGPLQNTGRNLDVAITGPALFMVQTPQGIRYTKNGSFNINGEGMLVDSKGNRVLSSDGQEIVFEDGDAAPNIGEDGVIYSGTTPRGQIGMMEFEKTYLLKKLGNGLFSSEVDGLPAEKSKIAQGMLSGSNVNMPNQMSKMIEVNRELAIASNMIADSFARQKSAFRIYSKMGG